MDWNSLVLIISSGILLLFMFINIGILFYKRLKSSTSNIMLREGSLTFFFYLACLLHILIIAVPFVYLLADYKNIKVEWNLAFLCLTSHSFFWIFLFWNIISIRHEYEVPLFLICSYTLSAFLIILPLFFWSHLFPLGFDYLEKVIINTLDFHNHIFFIILLNLF